jgi:hypothetical protein
MLYNENEYHNYSENEYHKESRNSENQSHIDLLRELLHTIVCIV